MNRLATALIAYVALGGLTYWTISDSRIRGITFAILALFAVKSVLRRKDVMHPDSESETDQAERQACPEPNRQGRIAGSEVSEPM